MNDIKKVSNNESKARRRKLKNWVVRYTFIEGKLSKRLFTMAYLKCLGKIEAKYALREVYKGYVAIT